MDDACCIAAELSPCSPAGFMDLLGTLAMPMYVFLTVGAFEIQAGFLVEPCEYTLSGAETSMKHAMAVRIMELVLLIDLSFICYKTQK